MCFIFKLTIHVPMRTPATKRVYLYWGLLSYGLNVVRSTYTETHLGLERSGIYKTFSNHHSLYKEKHRIHHIYIHFVPTHDEIPGGVNNTECT